MSRWVSGYATGSVLVVAGRRFEAAPGEVVDLPDHLDRLVPSHCPGWKRAPADAPRVVRHGDSIVVGGAVGQVEVPPPPPAPVPVPPPPPSEPAKGPPQPVAEKHRHEHRSRK